VSGTAPHTRPTQGSAKSAPFAFILISIAALLGIGVLTAAAIVNRGNSRALCKSSSSSFQSFGFFLSHTLPAIHTLALLHQWSGIILPNDYCHARKESSAAAAV
jgi:hypothetical protein